jgi:hypothetical protein
MDAPLVCELHAHSTWSDGSLELEEASTCTEAAPAAPTRIEPETLTLRATG